MDIFGLIVRVVGLLRAPSLWRQVVKRVLFSAIGWMFSFIFRRQGKERLVGWQKVGF
jgi:hypothetical protein